MNCSWRDAYRLTIRKTLTRTEKMTGNKSGCAKPPRWPNGSVKKAPTRDRSGKYSICGCFCFRTKKPAIIEFTQQLRDFKVAPAVGFEPTTNWLTANCATTAPRRKNHFLLRSQWVTKTGVNLPDLGGCCQL